MHVSALNFYPVKSLRGIARTEMDLEPAGFRFDRRWMVTAPDGTFITQRTCPQMALVDTEVTDGQLVLSVFGMDPHAVPATGPGNARLAVEVWGDRVQAVDTGDATAAWLGQALGVDCRLVAFPDDATRPCNPDHARDGDHTRFADGYPLLVVSEASLALLNEKLAEPVGMERFRPNIVITGCAPHAEDDWAGIEVDGVAIRTARPCPRCSVPTVDPAAGVLAGPEPIHTLSGYRARDGEIFFGVNMIPEAAGTLRVGAPVSVLA